MRLLSYSEMLTQGFLLSGMSISSMERLVGVEQLTSHLKGARSHHPQLLFSGVHLGQPLGDAQGDVADANDVSAVVEIPVLMEPFQALFLTHCRVDDAGRQCSTCCQRVNCCILACGGS